MLIHIFIGTFKEGIGYEIKTRELEDIHSAVKIPSS